MRGAAAALKLARHNGTARIVAPRGCRTGRRPGAARREVQGSRGGSLRRSATGSRPARDASPKSSSFTTPSRVTNTWPPFRSPWTTRFWPT
ncbi:MAG: hypothetical protein ACK52I_18915 [Pseudomonadota bacterium]